MINGKTERGSAEPARLSARKLAEGIFELRLCEDAETEEVTDAQGSRTQWKWEGFSPVIARAERYEDLVAPLVHLRYTIDDEIALARKSDTEAEKIDYLSFVGLCKDVAKAAFKEE